MSTFSISQDDLTPAPIPAADYERLTAEIPSLDAVVENCERTFCSWVGGMLKDEDHVAMARPQVVFTVVWYLHYMLSQNQEYQIPAAVQRMLDDARQWALASGQALLAAEGRVQIPGQGTVAYDAHPARFTRSQMDLL
jgi:hypothetical protein